MAPSSIRFERQEGCLCNGGGDSPRSHPTRRRPSGRSMQQGGTTRAGAEKLCSAPLSLLWSDDVLHHPGSRQEPSRKIFPKCELPHTSRPIPERCCLRMDG